jgi:dTDP-4-dehydrorhamnose 3,5-epimerase
LRGLHYQAAPFEEVKLVRCTMGAIYDVIIDLRTSSPTFRQCLGGGAHGEQSLMLYIPEGFAHSFQSLGDDTEVFYLMSQFYAPDYARGVRRDNPAFGLQWPVAECTISDKD